jgi:DNA-damage-inducible protein D
MYEQGMMGRNKDSFQKAKLACEEPNHAILDHFVDVNKVVELGAGSQREIDDITLARYACHLIAQNGDANAR